MLFISIILRNFAAVKTLKDKVLKINLCTTFCYYRKCYYICNLKQIEVMKRILFILLFLPMLPLAVCAAVKIGDIYYNLNSSDKTAELVYQRNHTYSGDVVIPSSVTYGDVEYSVTGIRGNAFWRSSELTSVTIPSSVTSIGRCAFTQCTELTYISIPNSVTN